MVFAKTRPKAGKGANTPSGSGGGSDTPPGRGEGSDTPQAREAQTLLKAGQLRPVGSDRIPPSPQKEAGED